MGVPFFSLCGVLMTPMGSYRTMFFCLASWLKRLSEGRIGFLGLE